MVRKRVIVVKTNLPEQDVRMPKEVRTLIRGGYAVTLLCWDRDGKATGGEERRAEDNYQEIRLRLRAPYGIRILPFLPIWWCFASFWLIVTRWDVAHAVNLDSAIPSLIVGKLKRKPVIYDMANIYVDQMLLPILIRNAFIKLDKLFMRLASGIIICDEGQIEEVGGIPNSRVTVVYDSPPDILNEINIAHPKKEKFTLFYGGVLFKARRLNLDKAFAAIKDIEGTQIVIAGFGDSVEEIQEWVRQMPNKIQFVGKISHEEVLTRGASADLLFALRDPLVPASKYICGSKLLEAMICGRPILVSKGTSTASKVHEENCGLVVDSNNVEEIKKAIVSLKDNPELLSQLGSNARRAYEQRYNWQVMEQRLIALYQEISG